MTKSLKKKIAVFQATVIDNPYIPLQPSHKQAVFLMREEEEVMFGGAARGGKTVGLLMAALQYVHHPDYAALLVRRTYTDLSLPGALIPMSHEWLGGTDAVWKEKKKTWVFPSGATLTFGYEVSERDKYRYQGAGLRYIGFDELSQFTETQYTYLFSRMTRQKKTDIPLRMRAASNPGGVGHEWVKKRFITPTPEQMKKMDRFFLPAFLTDNPFVDQEAYNRSLNRLDPVTREQLRYGNWDIGIAGNLFKREWFEVVGSAPPLAQQVRFWDMAATPKGDGGDPDWTVGCLLSEQGGIFFIKDIVRFRKTPAETERIIKQTAQMDGIETRIYMEQEPGASGVITIDHYAREVLKGFSFHGIRSTGSKITRAQPFSAACERGNVKICNSVGVSEMLAELELFPNGSHDDIVDALSGAFNQLNQGRDSGPAELISSDGRGEDIFPGYFSSSSIPSL